MHLRVGTSGFSYKEWKGLFYPAKLASKKMLPFYGEQFPTVEINNSFYRMPETEKLARWAAQVPEHFRFALKAPRQITHARRLRNTEEPVKQLFEVSAMLGDRLGPVLFQLPPAFEKDVGRLQQFLTDLPAGPKVAFEFRHPSWYDDEVYGVLRHSNAALCIAQSEDVSRDAPFVATADFGYIRLRALNYDEASLDAWASHIRSQVWSVAYVFFKHEDEASGPRFASMLQRSWDSPDVRLCYARHQEGAKDTLMTSKKATHASTKKARTSAKPAPARASSQKKRAPSPEVEATTPPASTPPAGGGTRATGGSAGVALEVLQAENAAQRVAEYGDQLLDSRETTATQAGRVLGEIVTQKPELVLGLVDRFTTGLVSENKRVVQTSADALPVIARLAPARVARHLEKLKTSFSNASDVGKDGIVRTFAALCTASVAYQKRLEPVLTKALGEADGRTLLTWTETVLPALKGEPHARARAVVERRLYEISRPAAQKIADFLGIKLRPAPR